MPSQLPKAYQPREVEERIYQTWEKSGYFRSDPASPKPPYSIVIPPPNVTGALHMGHALNNTIQDILIRYKRMDGFNTLWQPGTDHAGIATQNVVERQLKAEGTDRQTLGREKFIERVWAWRKESGGQILNQLKRLGSSCDWDRERFTMDQGLSRAVREVFVSLYEQGLVYRDDYITNWCPRCQTALADLEVEHHQVGGALYYVRYPLADGPGHLVVATTRPETMLGDTAVAVNPDDERFASFVGRQVRLPLTERILPVIADQYVDPSFGTGALKITPAHDPNDFEIGVRHDLPSVKAIDEEGRMNDQAGPYAGLDRFEARERVVADLEAQGLLEKVEPYNHSVGHCYRCKTMIEPLLSKQWFINVKPLAEKAVASVRDGRTRIIPDQWQKVFFEWMENIRPWCVSRQIWWGHRIPAWYCRACGQTIVARQDPEKCPCGGELVQETDVLDTWFSSGLWPFSTLGWPDQTPHLQTFYPTACLVTGFDILFFWVARMMMLGLWFMDEIPFADVYIHALVRDQDGQKMSKSKGNVMDPLDIMDTYGTDAFRFTLAAFAAQGRDVKLSIKQIEGYRHFINKLWNSARFTLMNLDGQPFETGPEALSLADRWILSRLNATVVQVRESLDNYHFDRAASALYQFVWHEMCDWYLELAKPALSGRQGQPAQAAARQTLLRTLKDVLKLLHPIIPFVTEEIWSKLPGVEGTIMLAPYPQAEPGLADPQAEAEMDRLKETVVGIRNIRGEFKLPPTKPVKAVVFGPDQAAVDMLTRHRAEIQDLAWTEELTVSLPGTKPKAAATAVAGGLEIFVPLAGLIDLAAEEARLAKELDKTAQELAKVEAKLNNPNFKAKAPAEIVAKEEAKLAELAAKKDKLRANLNRIRDMA
ncbi:MAG: valine--tRNA ligase [Deltaproteobacteria bacterium]|nr:valine--tRNA ligase [Deltaproteobacteria bacterium]